MKTIKVFILFFLFFFLFNFSVFAQRIEFEGLKAYWGDLHNHSGYSDDGPCALPDDVFEAAKKRGNDFLALTDHDSSLANPLIASLKGNCKLPPEENKWQKLKESAQRKTEEGVFVALAGFEWTHFPNHINVINSERADAPYSYLAFFDWLKNQPDKEKIIAQFNHPQVSDLNYFFLRKELQPIFRTIETNAFYSAYNPFLKNGWYVGAVGYGDSHSLEVMGSRTYGLWAEELTKEKVIEALLKRRTFSAAEPKVGVFPSIAIALKANNFWMGEKINADSFNFKIFASDPQRKITRILLLGGNPYTGGTGYHLIKEFPVNSNQASFEFYFKPNDPKYYRFYYLQVYALNNDLKEYLAGLSAPVFVEYNPLAITPTPTPVISPTITPLPGNCSLTGSPILDQQQTSAYIGVKINGNWGYGSPLLFSPKNYAKIDSLELLASGNGVLEAKIVDNQGKALTEVVSKKITNKNWVIFDFLNEGIVYPEKTYEITFRAASGTIYLWRANYWRWGYKLYLKPCLN